MTSVPICLAYSPKGDQMFIPYEEQVDGTSDEEYLLPSFWEDIFPGFQFSELIAQTSGSLVWKGKQQKSAEVIALKITSCLSEEISQQIHELTETAFLRIHKLKHMAQVKQIIHTQQYRMLVMDYFPYTLANMTQQFTANIKHRYTQRHIDFVISAFQSMITCVEELHNLGYVHRDLKCDNFLVDQQLRIVLNDFGLVTKNLQVDTSISGTLQYLAPERLSKKGRTQPIQKQVDIWSLGIILYELFTGQTPFKGNSQHELLDQICEGSFPQKKIPSSAMNLIQSILRLNKQKRLTLDQIKHHPFLQKTITINSITIII